jgi:hypothetical protein
MKIGSVVVDCNDFDTMSAFWAEALHHMPRGPAEDDWVVLRDPEGSNVNVSLQKVPEKASEKDRLHFDLYTTDQAAEVERLLGIGATRHPREPEPDEDFVVLADPEGNLFCVIDTGE